MKLKLLTFFFGITTILFGTTTWIYYLKTESRTKLLSDRELTITNYKKVVNAIGKSNDISVHKLITELRTDFDIPDNIGYYDYEKEYFYTLDPKDKTINRNHIWEFVGLELILDEQKNFKTINLRKF